MAQKTEYQQESKKRKIEQPQLTIQFESRTIPHDIAIRILSRLPIKSLLRFTAVCKSWYTFIKSPYFTRFHLHHQSNDTRNLAYFIHDDIHICSVNFPALNQVGGYEVGEINYPFKSTTSSVTILGSVNGIFLLGIHNDSRVMTTEHDDRLLFAFSALCIWNPSTREYRKLPDAFIKIPKYRYNCQRIVYGFGYDTVSDDYKVIRIFYYCDCIIHPASYINYYESDVHVYSLKANSFKRIQDIPYFIVVTHTDTDKGIFLNGAIHWLGRKVRRGRRDWLRCHDDYPFPIVCYNVSSEEYSMLETPEFCSSNVRSEVTFGVLEGCLCVCRQFKNNVLDVHIMKEYGVKESWTKIHSIRIEESVTHFKTSLTNNGEILFTMSSGFRDSSVSLYQPKEKGLVKLDIDGIPAWFPRLYEIEPYTSPRLYEVQPYIRCLVSMN